MKSLIIWRLSGKKLGDLTSSCGRFEIRTRQIKGSLSVRVFLLDHIQDVVHVFMISEDATKFAVDKVAREGKVK